MRPDEYCRLRWEHIHDGAVHIPWGKTSSARRVPPPTQRTVAMIDARRQRASCDWVFPALAGVPSFTMYDFRHTGLTRWAAHLDPYTLAYLAGHSDFSTTRRSVHPQTESIRAALERVRAQVETPAKKSRRALVSAERDSGSGWPL